MSQIDVVIMDQSYKLACKAGEEAALQQAAAYLNQKMCHFRSHTKITASEKIAVMAALSITTELFNIKTQMNDLVEGSKIDRHQQINHMNNVLEQVLTPMRDAT